MMQFPFPTWWGNVPDPPPLRYARPILAAAAPLERLIREGRKTPLDRAVSAHTRSRRMGKNDRALLSLAVYGFARNREGMLRALEGACVAEGGFLALGLIDRLAPDLRGSADDLFPGIVPALDRGLTEARSDLIARMDADDVSLPDRLQRQLDFLARHPAIDVVGTGIVRVTPGVACTKVRMLCTSRPSPSSAWK